MSETLMMNNVMKKEHSKFSSASLKKKKKKTEKDPGHSKMQKFLVIYIVATKNKS